jgi:presenilin-like A22 family membrane protease
MSFMRTKSRQTFRPAYWAIMFFILAQALTFLTAFREGAFVKANNITLPPQPPPESVTLWPTPPPVTPGAPEQPAPWSALGPVLIYIAAAVVVLGLTLFLLPLSALKSVLRGLFALLFAWGMFILLVVWLPAVVAGLVAVGIGAAWFLSPRLWLHDAVMIIAMASVGAVFGRFLSPWTAMALLLILSVYDLLAVRFGYMMWMVRKMSFATALPAFVIPRFASDWNATLTRADLAALMSEKPAEREYSILGGGDVGFPLLLASSVYFGYGLAGGLLVAGFCLAGLVSVYWIQSAFLKGRPVPALPPIAVMALIGLFIVGRL